MSVVGIGQRCSRGGRNVLYLQGVLRNVRLITDRASFTVNSLRLTPVNRD